jgi:hypothetical protein
MLQTDHALSYDYPMTFPHQTTHHFSSYGSHYYGDGKYSGLQHPLYSNLISPESDPVSEKFNKISVIKTLRIKYSVKKV